MSEEDIKTGKVINIELSEEVKKSYLTYAMSVIVSRALPDVRDGLKPVHRRILYSMHDTGMHYNKETKKCARIVGDVLGKYHPHGDQSVYDALVRLAQDFSLRYPLIFGQGNFGSIDNDPPAAMRYTEAKLAKISDILIKDIDKDTVDWQANYDDTTQEPKVLPAGFPNLLVNGSSGIAVGMATNMAPHNLNEVCNAIFAYIDNPDITIDELMRYIQAPDFPTGGIIYGVGGIKSAFKTGKGRIVVRAKCSLEVTRKGRDVIVISEIPYSVCKASLIERIAELVKDEKIDGISAIRDESDRKTKVRIIIELKKGTIPNVTLNQLFAHTDLQKAFNVNNLALVNGRPKLLNLKELIFYYVEHRKEVVTRRTQFNLNKAEERAHILEGLKIALDNIDEVIKTIKESKTVQTAEENLISKFKLTSIQAKAILDMKLQKLTSLETQKIIDELNELYKLIAYYKELLADEGKILNVVKDELKEVSETNRAERKTEIVGNDIKQIEEEDLITEEDVVVLITNEGFIKRVPISMYRNQRRGGKGSSSSKFHVDDFLKNLFIASTHDYITFISSEGKAYWLKVHEIPETTKIAKGTHIRQMLSISTNEEITAIVSFKDINQNGFLMMATKKGVVKKVKITEFANAKTRGIRAINLQDGDKLVSAELTDGTKEIFLVTQKGLMLRYNEENIRHMGRSTKGITGIKLSGNDEVVAVFSISEKEEMLLVSEFGYGKRMSFDKITPHGRATRGQTGYKTNEKTGDLVSVLTVNETDEIICVTSQSITIKLEANTIPSLGKTATGVKIIDVKKPDFLVGMARIIKEED